MYIYLNARGTTGAHYNNVHTLLDSDMGPSTFESTYVSILSITSTSTPGRNQKIFKQSASTFEKYLSKVKVHIHTVATINKYFTMYVISRQITFMHGAYIHLL